MHKAMQQVQEEMAQAALEKPRLEAERKAREAAEEERKREERKRRKQEQQEREMWESLQHEIVAATKLQARARGMITRRKEAQKRERRERAKAAVIAKMLQAKPFLISFVGGTVGAIETSEFSSEYEYINTTLRKAKEQVAASAFCSTIYETLPSTTLTITQKEDAVRLAKKKVAKLGISVPVLLMKQLETTLKAQQASAKAAAKAAAKKK